MTRVNMKEQMVMFLGTIYKSERGLKPYEKLDIDKLILSPNFYKYIIKKNLINDGQMKFRNYPIELDYDENADIWGMTGKEND
jgi:hypothetical protein